jgi:hypothetical protein
MVYELTLTLVQKLNFPSSTVYMFISRIRTKQNCEQKQKVNPKKTTQFPPFSKQSPIK